MKQLKTKSKKEKKLKHLWLLMLTLNLLIPPQIGGKYLL